ncbi:sigma-70 family RNA polymerase sigma factor [Bacillus mexicanus]|uniref:sigma-70 family RNA polymerase sigma factor n=1 Tax=Bacillus mexicanus TaxID=2834415 RepID=UPI003D1A8140
MIKTQQKEQDILFESVLEQYKDMIWDISRKYRYKTKTLNIDELFQFGMFGLWKAIINFDPTKKYKFSTYASHNISGHILNGINKEKQNDLPRNKQSIKERVLYFIDLKEIEGWTWKETQRQSGFTEKEWRDFTTWNQEKVYLHSKQRISDNDDVELIHLIPGDLGIEEKVIEKETVNEIYSALDEQEKIIFKIRYIEGYNKSESAKILNIPKTTFSRKEEKILNKIVNQKDLTYM